MSPLIIAALVAGGLIVLFLVFAALQPAEFTVRRATTIAAPPPVVFALINDFRQWRSWSPWEKLDPNLQRTHSGAAAGTGAVYDWTGNKKVGQGRMTILESQPNERIAIKLEFIKPFAVTNTTVFTLRPVGGQTEVLWEMRGVRSFGLKAFGLLMPMDKIVGRDFEKGLEQMKVAAEQKNT